MREKMSHRKDVKGYSCSRTRKVWVESGQIMECTSLSWKLQGARGRPCMRSVNGVKMMSGKRSPELRDVKLR